ncbi:MAG: succinyl-diaminopimelate desuccinylase [Rubrivivax sp.]
MTSAAVRLAEQLIACPSVSPDDAGCQSLIAQRLQAAGFDCVHLPHGPAGAVVSNLWAVHRGTRPGPVVGLAGHTDVVPPGPASAWTTPPFVPSHRDGRLYGRGAADMKTAVAAMVVAAEALVAAQPDHAGAVALLITSDEEALAVDGTVRIVEWLQQRGERLDACIVGEATSVERLGDMIKNGRRGSLSGRLVVRGVQGHVAYPQLARNPLHELAPALAELVAMRWDEGDAFFPPTTWQVSNLNAGTGARNVIPGEAVLEFNFRFSPASAPETLRQRLHAVLERHGVDHRIDWTLGAEPFLTEPGSLSAALSDAIEAECGLRPVLSTTGGTSDGRFIRRICPQVIEFGPVNASIHQVDEHVEVASIEPLTRVYRRTLERLLA